MSAETAIHSRRTILVAEDDALVRTVLAEALREPGHQVIEARSGDEALSVLQAGQAVDLLVTDVQMPGKLDGIALARAVRSTFPHMRVVIAASALGKLIPGDVDRIFAKPYAVEDVVQYANQLLAEQGDRDAYTESA